MHNVHPFEVVGRGNETQIQMGKILNYLKRHNQIKIIKESVILFRLLNLTAFLILDMQVKNKKS